MIIDTQASDQIERVYKAYKSRMASVLDFIKARVELAGFKAREPIDLSDDYYRWSLVVSSPRTTDEWDITLEISEARSYGDAPDTGITFGIDIVHYGGRIVGQFQPFNFTPDVWVDALDAEAVEERFKLIEEADINEIPQLLLDDEGKGD